MGGGGSRAMSGKTNLLITGPPGVGKTTLAIAVAHALKPLEPVGFYTSEIREGGTRKGFELVSLDGVRDLLSHIDIRGPHKVGKYGIDLRAFERFLGLVPFGAGSAPIVIDEIGKMECFSEPFKTLVRAILDSPRTLVATIALRGAGFIAEVKARRDITLFELSRQNRDFLVVEILREVIQEA
jgi:nucleoside-triphosphatase